MENLELSENLESSEFSEVSEDSEFSIWPVFQASTYRITSHKRAPHLVVHALISGFIFKTGNIQKSTIFGMQLHAILMPDPKICHF